MLIATKQLLEKGSTMIELLIALMVVGLVVTAITLAGTYSIKNTSQARYKQVATALAQEVVEKSRSEENRLGFSAFVSLVGSNTFCFDSLPDNYSTDLPSVGGCASNDTISLAGTDFIREVSFASDNSTIEVEITVFWQDGESTKQIIQKQQLVKENFN